MEDLSVCAECGKKLPQTHSSQLCFFCRHKMNLTERGITECSCWMCQREKGLLKEKVLEESFKELDKKFDRELYQKFYWKWQKRRQRGTFSGNVQLEAR